MSKATNAPAASSFTPQEWAEPVGLLRSVVLGALTGIVLSFTGTLGGMLAAGAELESALGIAVFVAFWGGLGFGTMVGGVTWVSANEEHAAHPHEG